MREVREQKKRNELSNKDRGERKRVQEKKKKVEFTNTKMII